MITAADYLNELRTLIGTTEQPPGSNHNFITEWYGLTGAWCAMTVSYALAHAGFPAFHYAYCPYVVADARKGALGMVWHSPHDDIRAGDLLLWDWDGDGVADHISTAELDSNGGGSITTIGGNEGVGVCQRSVRSRGALMGFARLPFATSEANPSPQPQEEDMGKLVMSEPIVIRPGETIPLPTVDGGPQVPNRYVTFFVNPERPKDKDGNLIQVRARVVIFTPAGPSSPKAFGPGIEGDTSDGWLIGDKTGKSLEVAFSQDAPIATVCCTNQSSEIITARVSHIAQSF